LAATIKQYRPELIKEELVPKPEEPVKPISETPPADYFLDQKVSAIEDIGIPTNACFFTNTDFDPIDWYV